MVNLSKKLFSSLLIICMLLSFATGVVASATTGKLNGNGVNFRVKSSLDGKVIKTLKKGKTVTILGKTDGWYKAKVDSKVGYIKSEFVSIIKPTSKPAYINAGIVNLRKASSTKSKILGKLKSGAKISVISSKGNWCKIRTSNGKVGYVTKKFVKITSKSSRGSSARLSKGQQIVDYAKKYIGVKYVYASEDPSTGFDCSGFAWYVYKHFGYTINRSSSGIANNGKAVSKSDLQPGDLLLFKQHGSYDHVAIYVGGGKMIHAETKSGINIDSVWDNSYYENCYAKAVRII